MGPMPARRRLVAMDITARKHRRLETPEERSSRLGKEASKALDRALAEQDAIDAMIRLSIERHGP